MTDHRQGTRRRAGRRRADGALEVVEHAFAALLHHQHGTWLRSYSSNNAPSGLYQVDHQLGIEVTEAKPVDDGIPVLQHFFQSLVFVPGDHSVNHRLAENEARAGGS